MRISSPMYVLVVLLSASAALIGCSRDSSDLTRPATAQPVSLSAEPSPLTPEFLSGRGCVAPPAFGLRLVLGLGGPSHIVFRRVRFRFEDRFGGTAVPLITIGTSLFPAAPGVPNSGPVPIPSAPTMPGGSPIPVPSATSLPGVVTPLGSSRQLPLGLEFGCGVRATGTLIVVADLDDRGRTHSSEVRVRVE